MTTADKQSAALVKKAARALAVQVLRDKTLTPSVRLVGWYIADHINKWRGYAWPPMETIADDLGISLRLVKYAVEKHLGKYFKIDRSNRQYEYRIGANFAPIEAGDRCKKRQRLVQKSTAIGANFAPHPYRHPKNHPLRAKRGSKNLDLEIEEEEKKKSHPFLTDAPQFQAWRTYYRDTNQHAMVRQLDQKTLENRAFDFPSEWPPH